ncbi:unnamed protein product [Rotaria socialis]|nr:unnamed protein product [Rotaria socialis]
MDYVQIYDERKKSTARLLIAADNILKKDYLNIYFRGAIGIFFFDQQLNQDVYIPPDDNGNFRFNWDQDIIYKLVYSNDSRSLSMSASSSTTKSWNILTIIGSIIIIWLGSMIPSLWSNLYDDAIKHFFYDYKLNMQSEGLYWIRVVLLLVISVIYIASMVYFTPTLIKSVVNKIKNYFQNSPIDTLRYIPPSRGGPFFLTELNSLILMINEKH